MQHPPRPATLAGRTIGRYQVFDEIAAGGMATVHLGRLNGPKGFARTVAIKRLRPGLAGDPELTTMLVDEARMAARVQHPNVVSVIDVLEDQGEVLLVMEYVRGVPLSALLRAAAARQELLPVPVAAHVMVGALLGLHAAHQATSDRGLPLSLVHRDVSPQNILVGINGTPRVVDFGIAKADDRLTETREGHIKGKFRYIGPEQVCKGVVGPWTDVWAASVVLWEALTGKALFDAAGESGVLQQVLSLPIPSPREHRAEVPEALAEAVLAGLVRNPDDRVCSALEMSARIEHAVGSVSPRDVAACLRRLVGAQLDAAAERVLRAEAAAPPAEARSSGPALDAAPASDTGERGGAVVSETAAGISHTVAPPADPPAPEPRGEEPSQARQSRAARGGLLLIGASAALLLALAAFVLVDPGVGAPETQAPPAAPALAMPEATEPDEGAAPPADSTAPAPPAAASAHSPTALPPGSASAPAASPRAPRAAPPARGGRRDPSSVL